MTVDKRFVENLKRIRRANGLPVDVKLPDSILEHDRLTCADCGNEVSTVSFTVEDIFGNERPVCSRCWCREERAA